MKIFGELCRNFRWVFSPAAPLCKFVSRVQKSFPGGIESSVPGKRCKRTSSRPNLFVRWIDRRFSASEWLAQRWTSFLDLRTQCNKSDRREDRSFYRDRHNIYRNLRKNKHSLVFTRNSDQNNGNKLWDFTKPINRVSKWVQDKLTDFSLMFDFPAFCFVERSASKLNSWWIGTVNQVFEYSQFLLVLCDNSLSGLVKNIVFSVLTNCIKLNRDRKRNLVGKTARKF